MTNSPGIVIVGLGPGDPDARTLGTQRALDRAGRIILRTRIHPGLEEFATDSRVTDCDDLYERADDFDRLYQQIADRVLAATQRGEVVFAVPGHPRFGERSVPLIEAAARASGVPVTVLDAVSFVDAAASALRCDVLAAGLQVADAEHLAATLDEDPFAAGTLGIDPTRLLLIGQVYNRGLAASVKIALSRVYPEEHPVVIVQAAGVPSAQDERSVALHTLDRQMVDHLTSVWVPPLPPLEAVRSPEALTRVVARLRKPDGCPWDREQDHASLRGAVLEEAYEVADAIDSGDGDDLAEELGDLLLLVTMHAQIAEEDGSFRIEDVYEEITRKLIRRHPHVFGDVIAVSPDAVVTTWEGVKAAEREEKGITAPRTDPLTRLPRAMPATRKMVELLAPRTTLRAPEQSSEGEAALQAIVALIERGIDPESALESALRRAYSEDQLNEESLAAVGPAGDKGGAQA
jgi:tetrapyrrole methylase family protein / MazG family protein